MTLYLTLGLSGLVFASSAPLWLLVAIALTGALSAEVIESGPFTSTRAINDRGRLDANALARGFGWLQTPSPPQRAHLGCPLGRPPPGCPYFLETTPARPGVVLVVLPVAALGMVIAHRLSYEWRWRLLR